MSTPLPRPSRPARPTRALLALLALHALTAFPFPWEDTTRSAAWLRVNPDLVVVLAFATLIALAYGYRAWLGHLAALALLFVPLYRFGDTIMPVYYGRPFQPWFDVDLIPGLIHLLTHELAPALQAAITFGAILALVLVYAATYRATAAVLRLGARPGWGYGLLIGAQLLVIAAWAGRQIAPAAADPVLARGTFARAAGEIAQVFTSGSWRTAERFAARAREADAALAACPTDLAGLAGVDVYVMFIESYGRSIWRDPALAPVIGARMQKLAARAAERGLAAATAFTTPSVSGGGSAYAHAEFLAGFPVENGRIFDLLIASERPSLPRLLRAAGRRTVSVHPAMVAPWPAGRAFYAFDAELFQPELGYAGAAYGWGRMPDQFALARLLTREVQTAKQPLFVHYVSVTSHAPFSLVPPYVDNWSRAATSEAFVGAPAHDHGIHWSNYTTHPQLPEAYLETIHYSLETMLGFAAELERPSLVLILGDHQPPVKQLQACDPSFDVPLHAVTNRPALLAPFHAAGALPGLTPHASQEAFPAREFLYRFLQGYSRPPPK